VDPPLFSVGLAHGVELQIALSPQLLELGVLERDRVFWTGEED
jgi:hypothetical protein